MWFNCIYGYNNPFMNFFSPFMNFNFIPMNTFMPFNNIWQMNYFTPNFMMPSNTVSIFSRQKSIDNLEKRLATSSSMTNKKTVEKQTAVKTKAEKIENTNLIHGIKYNKQKGELLAKNVVEGLPTDRDPDNPLCARYVKNAIVRSGLGPYINGNGEYCKYILRANKNFKEVKVKSSELATLPAGSIIVYDAFDKYKNSDGSSGQIGKDGHVLITLGDGRGCSDILEDTIPQSARAHTFIPV